MPARGLRQQPVSAPLACGLLPTLLSAGFSSLHTNLTYLLLKLAVGLDGSAEKLAGPLTLKSGNNLPVAGLAAAVGELMLDDDFATAAAASVRARAPARKLYVC